MATLRRWFLRLFTCLRPGPADSELTRELASHLAMLEDDLRRQGMTADEARFAARRASGGVEQAKELHRDVRSFPWLDDVPRDVRYTLRELGRNPGFAVVAVMTLALGIGATTAVFSVVDGVLLKPLPVEDQQRLLVVWKSVPERAMEHWPFSYASYEAMRERLRTVSGLAAHPYAVGPTATLQSDGEAMLLEAIPVTGEWFDVLGVKPHAGRLLTAADDHVGAAPVLVLSSGLAERLFGSSGAALGRALRIHERAYTVVGITPPDFEFPRGSAAWAPAAVLVADMEGVPLQDANRVTWDLVARVGPGFTVAQTRSELASALSTLPAQSAVLGKQMVHTALIADIVVGDVRPALLMLAGAVLLVLLVTAVNVANLLLVRGLARQREVAVRTAIGASRGRILRQFATEALVLSAVGAVLAVFVAYAALYLLLVLAPPDLPRLAEIRIDGRALAFTGGAAMVAAVLFGMLLAKQTVGVQPGTTLQAHDCTDAPGTGRYWLRHSLVVAQVAITVLVVSMAGLLVVSVNRLQRLSVGFPAEDLLLVDVAMSPYRYAEPADQQRALVRLAERAASLPGIRHASAVYTHPFAGSVGADILVFAEGQALDQAANPFVNYEGADSTLFATLGLPVLLGRGIQDSDRAGRQPVVVVNRSFSRLFWGDANPIGRRIKWGREASTGEWRTVVGLVPDTRYRELTAARPTVYVPYEQGIPISPRYLAVRTNTAAAVAASIRRLVATEEPGAMVVGVTPLTNLLDAPLARPRFQSALVTCLAVLAVVLSVTGAYGVLAFFVRQRSHEIGIRMALGASPSDMRRLVVWHGLMIVVPALLVGIAAAVAAGRLIQPLLFGVTAADPFVSFAAAGSVLVATMAATLLPARRAGRIDPAVMLREG